MAKEMATLVPTNRYIVWDLALSNKGWVIVEANYYGEFYMSEVSSKKGVRLQLENYMKDNGVE